MNALSNFVQREGACSRQLFTFCFDGWSDLVSVSGAGGAVASVSGAGGAVASVSGAGGAVASVSGAGGTADTGNAVLPAGFVVSVIVSRHRNLRNRACIDDTANERNGPTNAPVRDMDIINWYH